MKELTLILDFNGVLEHTTWRSQNANGTWNVTTGPFHGSVEAVERLSKFYTIVIATAGGVDSAKYIEAFVKKYFPAIEDVIYTRRKDLLNCTVQVDDSEYNLGENNAIPILFWPLARPNNSQHLQVKDWPTLERVLTQLAIELYKEEV